MKLPTPQGLSCSTFRPPPPDGSLTFPEIFDFHAKNSPNHPLFRYTDADDNLQTIDWARAVQGFHKAAQITLQRVAPKSSDVRPVIGIVAVLDQITYFSVICGILRAGYQAFPVSPRNSDVAVAHLLQSTNCSHIFVSKDGGMQKLAGAAAAKLATMGKQLTILPIPTFSDLFAPSSEPVQSLPPMPKLSLDAPAVILHSSGLWIHGSAPYLSLLTAPHTGSTAFPKTIIHTFRIMMESGLIPYYGQMDLCGHTLSAHAVPMFHLMGVIQLSWTAFTGLSMAVFPPTSPPTIPTPDRVFDGAVSTNSSLFFSVPAFLESWARDPHRIPILQKFRTVIFAGGPLQPTVGDMLVRQGIHIAHVYGLTETSNICMFLPDAPPEEGWDYFYMSPHTDPVFEPVEDIPGVFHLIVKKTPHHTPAVLDTYIDGVPALRTNDLFVKHPTNPNLVKVYGRHDDQIMHSNGEKTNPGPLEAILLKDTRIKYAVMFGRSQFHAGVLLFPAEPFDPADDKRVIEFRREIWPTIVEANRYAPQHSRIFKEMILIADPSRPVELTAKGTLRRQTVLDMYKEEIQAVFEAVAQSSQIHLDAPQEFDSQSSLEFVRRVVAEVMLDLPGDDDDIFQQGCDSLQATWIRNSLLHALRSSQRVDMKTVPSNFVYTYPTLRLLADLLTRLTSGAASTSQDITRRTEAMRAMVQKYSEGFPERQASEEATTRKEEVVLVTGTTGALGSHILAQLLCLPEVSKVYAANRLSTSDDLRKRHESSFSANGLDLDLLVSPKLVLLEAELNQPKFGLSSEEYNSLKHSVTTIIHNGWQVNFNISLSSMEPLVAGTRNLVDFALSCTHTVPPRFVFVSTAGVFRNLDTKVALEERLSDPRVAVGLGYTESKWVAEQIPDDASQSTGFEPVIVRPGQLSGAENGAWNSSDWFPALLRASQLLGHLPTISGYASWFPMHHAAKAVIEMRTSHEKYLHITHPKPVAMTKIISPLSGVLGLPLIPYLAWLELLEAAALNESSASNNPGVRLLDFFRTFQKNASDEDDALSPVALSNTHATMAASSMLSVAPLAARDVELWVAYLRQGGYLS